MKEETPKEISTNKKWLNDYAHRFVWHPQENVYLTEHVALLGNIPSDYPLPQATKPCTGNTIKNFCPTLPSRTGCTHSLRLRRYCHFQLYTQRHLKYITGSKELFRKSSLYFIGGLHLKDGMEPEQGIARMAKILNTTYPEYTSIPDIARMTNRLIC